MLARKFNWPLAFRRILPANLRNIPKEKHPFFERNKLVVTSRIKPGFLANKRETCIHIPKMLYPSFGITLATQLLDSQSIGAAGNLK
jgi:hypothetical protein